MGNPVGVFIPIDEWNHLAEALHLEIPQWQKDIIDLRLDAYHKNPGDTRDWDEIRTALNKEDEAA